MAQCKQKTPRHLASACAATLIALAAFLLAFAPPTAAQDPHTVTINGYITAVDSADRFEVNGAHVSLTSATRYAPMEKSAALLSFSHEDLRIGAFVRVVGSDGTPDHDIAASAIYFRDDFDQKLHGLSVIEDVMSEAPEPLLKVDGYRVRIAGNTEISFRGNLNSIHEVRPGIWISFAGKRNAEGEVVAATARFVPAKSRTRIAPRPQVRQPAGGSLVDALGNVVPAHTKVRINNAGGLCAWHKIAGDAGQQARVLRVGESLIPSYENQIALNDTARTVFRFYVVEDEAYHAELPCEEGVILVPQPVLARLKNDDQLAAVLADGIAYELQSARATLLRNHGLTKTEIVAEDAAYVLDPLGFFLAQGIVSAVVDSAEQRRLEEERGRLALSLMADAGFDPWQAPEAWRLLQPKHLPGDLDALRYPDRSGYQLGMLNVQYRKLKDAPSPASSR